MGRFLSRAAQAERLAIAREAARVLAEEGVRDFLFAKRKAIERLGADGHQVPTNQEVETALVAHQQLFRGLSAHNGATPEKMLHTLRIRALAAMRRLQAFRPRVVGAPLSGVVADDTPVSLHVFADAPETIAIHLMNVRVDYELDETRLRFGDGTVGFYPLYRFDVRGGEVEAVVFDPKAIRQAPLSRIDGKPMRRTSMTQLQALLDADTASSSV